MHAVALVVVDRIEGRYRDLVEIGSSQARDLCVHLRVNAPDQQRVVGEINAGYHMGGAKRHLFGFGEKVVRIAVQNRVRWWPAASGCAARI